MSTMKGCTCDSDFTICPHVTGSFMRVIGVAFAAAGYAATGFYSDKPTETEFRALEEYEERNGIEYVIRTYFYAWCDAGKPQPRPMPPVLLVNTMYGQHLEDEASNDTDYPENNS